MGNVSHTNVTESIIFQTFGIYIARRVNNICNYLWRENFRIAKFVLYYICTEPNKDLILMYSEVVEARHLVLEAVCEDKRWKAADVGFCGHVSRCFFPGPMWADVGFCGSFVSRCSSCLFQLKPTRDVRKMIAFKKGGWFFFWDSRSGRPYTKVSVVLHQYTAGGQFKVEMLLILCICVCLIWQKYQRRAKVSLFLHLWHLIS